MNTKNQAFEIPSIAGYGLSATLGILAIVYGQCVFTAVSIAQPALF
ncbi:MAG: hypothetical protein KUG71_09160 [Porticoccaceae bacterium]|nr:hypothetical protein [Porticoccaceae bacterium]